MRPSRWEHFAQIYGLSLLALAPGWVAYLSGHEPSSLRSAALGVSAALPPVLAAAAAVRRLPRGARRTQLVAVAGGFAAYCLAAVVLLAASPLWPVVLVVTPIISGAAVGSAIASVILRLFWFAGRREFAASSSREERGTGSVRFALWAGAVTGAILMPAFSWTGRWTPECSLTVCSSSRWSCRSPRLPAALRSL